MLRANYTMSSFFACTQAAQASWSPRRPRCRTRRRTRRGSASAGSAAWSGATRTTSASRSGGRGRWARVRCVIGTSRSALDSSGSLFLRSRDAFLRMVFPGAEPSFPRRVREARCQSILFYPRSWLWLRVPGRPRCSSVSRLFSAGQSVAAAHPARRAHACECPSQHSTTAGLLPACVLGDYV